MSDALGRLRRRADFLRIAGARRKWATPGLILQVSPTPDTGGRNPAPRVGFTVTRRVGAAVVRNRAKRRLRAVTRAVLAEHGARGHDFVVIGRKGTLERPYDALVDDLENALHKLKVWRNGENGPK